MTLSNWSKVIFQADIMKKKQLRIFLSDCLFCSLAVSFSSEVLFEYFGDMFHAYRNCIVQCGLNLTRG